MGMSERRLKKEAVEIASQLPESKEDALAILRLAAEVVRWWADGDQASALAPIPALNVSTLSRMRRDKPTDR